MAVGLGRSNIGGDRDVSDEVVRAEAAGNHFIVRHRAAYLRAVYRGGEDGGIQKFPTVMVPIIRPHTGGAGLG